MSNEPHPTQNSPAIRAKYATSTPARKPRLKAFGLVVGAGAVLAAVAFTLAQPDNSAEVHRGLTASGNHNPTFAPPNVPGMNMGATVVSTTPTTVLPVEKAVPQVKAGH